MDGNTAFLKKYLEKGGVATDVESGQEVNAENAQDFLQQTIDDKQAQRKEEKTQKLSPEERKQRREEIRQERAARADELKQERLHKKAEKLDAASSEADDKQQAKDTAERVENEKKKELEKNGRVRDHLASAASDIGDNVSSLADKIGNSHLPPGGIGLLVAIIIFLLFVVVKVNAAGQTRLKMFWYMLNEQAEIQGRLNLTPAMTGQPGGAVGSFGTPPVVPGTTGNVPNATVPPTNGLAPLNSSLYR